MSTTTKSSTAESHRRQTDSVALRVEKLRELAQDDSLAARDQGWRLFREAGDRLRTDRDVALGELASLFRTGKPPVRIDGQTEGMLVGWSASPVFDRLIGAITDAWLPWAGKRFDADGDSGDNVLVASARWPSKLLWPRYPMRPFGSQLTAFDFNTYVEPGVLDPGLEVLVIDYASVGSNPRLLIKQIRDELVEVVPGANLGKMIFEGPGPRHTLLAYFALKSSV